MNYDELTLDTNLEQCKLEELALGNQQYMGQDRISLVYNDCQDNG
jgi:hypothetical protein